MYSILIVEDHPVLAGGVERYLGSHLDSPEIHVTGRGHDCLVMLQKQHCDIVLLDINLPDISGVDLCSIISTSYPAAKVIALTGSIDTASVTSMKQAGAAGYILKTAIADELIDGIEAVMKGEIYISRDLEA
jgi:DNA-binding NarL/FixJ family response regulator